jgi:hypothetical protein
MLQKLIEASKTYITKTSSDVICGPDTRHHGVITIEAKYWAEHNDIKPIVITIMDYDAELLVKELTKHLSQIDQVLGRVKK